MRKGIQLLLALCLTLSICACGQKASAWQEQYDLGVRYLSEGNYEEAIIVFTAAIEIDPKQPMAYVGRGDAYVGTGGTDDILEAALADYIAAVELDEQLADVYTKIADIYLIRGNRGAALKWLRNGYDVTDSELLLKQIQRLEDPFSQRQNYCDYSNFSKEEKNYIASLLDVLKTEDLTKIRVFILETGSQIGRIVENTSSSYKRQEASEGVGRKNTFGTCYTYSMLDSGEKLAISCAWIGDGDECRDLNYMVEIHPQEGQGYFLYYTDYTDAYRLSFLTGQCQSWNWDGKYWRYEFDNVFFPDYAASGIYTGHYIAGTASGGFVDGTETEREVSGLVIGVDDPMAQHPATTKYTFDSGNLLSVSYGSRMWGRVCENGEVTEWYEVEDDGSQRQISTSLSTDTLLKPTGWSASVDYAEDDIW